MPGPKPAARGPGSRVAAPGEKAHKGRPGRPKKFTAEQVTTMQALAQYQIPLDSIAATLGVSEATLQRAMLDDPKISAAFAKGRATGMVKAHSWAYKRAFIDGGGNVEMARFWLRTKGGFVEPARRHILEGDLSKPGAAAPVVNFVLNGSTTSDPDAELQALYDKPQAK